MGLKPVMGWNLQNSEPKRTFSLYKLMVSGIRCSAGKLTSTCLNPALRVFCQQKPCKWEGFLLPAQQGASHVHRQGPRLASLHSTGALCTH